MALTVTGPINIAYAGGAAGPATTTQAALAAGFAITTMPVGGTATFTAPVNITGTVNQTNTATVAPPSGTTDPVPGNNSATAGVTVTAAPCCLAFSNVVTTPSSVPASTSVTVKATISETCGSPAVAGTATLTGLPPSITGTLSKPYPALAANGTFTITWNLTNTNTTAITANGNVTSTTAVPGCPPNLPFSFTTVALPPVRTTNVRTIKSITVNSSPTVGVLSTFQNHFINDGPDNADGTALHDNPGAGYGSNWVIAGNLPINLTYAGGAAGPASVSLATLISAAGITIPTWPAGGEVFVTYQVSSIAGSTANVNTATLSFPPDITDTNPSDNTDPLQFDVLGAALSCACSSVMTIDQTDVFAGSPLTGNATTPGAPTCCTPGSASINIRYWFPANDPSQIAQSAAVIPQAVSCGATTPYNDPAPAAGWYRFSVFSQDSLGGICERAEGGYVVNSAANPNQYQQAIDSGTWPVHHVI